jgi:NAD+ diphosphatase
MAAMARRNYFSTVPQPEGFLDRAGHLRRDTDWLSGRLADPSTRLLLLQSGTVVVDEEHRLVLVSNPGADIDHAAEGVVFLGLDAEGTAVFALDADADHGEAVLATLTEDHRFVDLRGAAARLPEAEGHQAAYASAMLSWHRRHRFCGACGSPTAPDWAGHVRRCANCGGEHFPRTDPVIIVLVTAGDHCLLGRQAAWPARMWSALAGFVEPGESLEDAVAREVAEETAVKVLSSDYHSSQPWPFPLSLMLGFHATAGDTPTEVTVDTTELGDAQWMTRDQLREGIEDGGITVPPPFSIARNLIDSWLAG